METNQSVNLLNVTCDCLLEGIEGDTNQPMQPVTAFLRSSNVTCDSLIEGVEGDTHQLMSPVTAFVSVWREKPIYKCHL